jgi:hypothetical protein
LPPPARAHGATAPGTTNSTSPALVNISGGRKGPAALAKVRDTSENGLAVVGAIKAGEQLRVGDLAAEAAATRRATGSRSW